MEGMVEIPREQFWRGKRVLITGHTGFKGSWLGLALARQGAHVAGVALPPSTEPNLFTLARVDKLVDSYSCDIRCAASLTGIVTSVCPDIVFHLAAQSLVRAGYRDPVDTVAVNVMGTTHLLEALRGINAVRVAVLVTTDKVYKNREWPYPYREDDLLGGHDPYSASKAAAELIAESFRLSYLAERGVAVATARAGNVIGGGDWSADRLIPDAVRAWSAGTPLHVRHPGSVRPWQHVLDPLYGYVCLAERLWEKPELAGSYNFGPQAQSAAAVRSVVENACASYGGGNVAYGQDDEGPHEAGLLTLDSSKARALLGFAPRWTLETAIERTMKWYRRQADGVDARRLCEEDIAQYLEDSGGRSRTNT
ncbi:MAG: CDP-glucose 4,6-dehydratase, partial [Nitrospira sp.]|nr:CDP-glucose 4,6-dehydratase [Nitrospira sp.]